MEENLEDYNQDTSDVPEAKKWNFDRSDLISILAVLLSLGAFGVSILQANIMKAQQEIMSTQQKSAVLPYLIGNIKSSRKKDKEVVYEEFSIKITNKGFGPALVKNIEIKMNDKIYTKGYQLLLELSGNENLNLSAMSVGNFKDVFISPGEEFSLIDLSINHDETESIDYLKLMKLKYKFCSILDDCWIYENGENTKI